MTIEMLSHWLVIGASLKKYDYYVGTEGALWSTWWWWKGTFHTQNRTMPIQSTLIFATPQPPLKNHKSTIATMTMSILFIPLSLQCRTSYGGSIKVHKNLQTKWCLINSTNVRPFSRLWMPRPDSIHSTDRMHCHSYLNFDSSVILNQQCFERKKSVSRSV